MHRHWYFLLFTARHPTPLLCAYLYCLKSAVSRSAPALSLTRHRLNKQETAHQTTQMHVTACLAGQKVDVEVGEDCRSLQALREAIVEALPQLCVEGFDVSVGGRALDDDEGVVSLEENVCLDVSANSRGLSVLALREAGREVSEAGLLKAARKGDVALSTLYLDAGVPLDCVCWEDRCTPLHHACHCGRVKVARLFLDRGSTAIDAGNRDGSTPLHLACDDGHLEVARLLLDRGSTAIDARSFTSCTPLHHACANAGGKRVEIVRLLLDRGSAVIDRKGRNGDTPLHNACSCGDLEIATLLLDRGSTAIDKKDRWGNTPLHCVCGTYAAGGRVKVATLLLDRGSTAINAKNGDGETPLHISCRNNYAKVARLLLDRGGSFDVEKYRTGKPYSQKVLRLLSERGYDVLPDASLENAKRRRIGKQ